jgi:hypothetical protein
MRMQWRTATVHTAVDDRQTRIRHWLLQYVYLEDCFGTFI